MSTHMYLHCVTHDPAIRSEEVGHNQSYLPMIREAIRSRDDIVKNMTSMVESNDLYPEFNDTYLAARWWFLYKHPHCDLEIYDEYGREYSMEDTVSEEPIAMDTVLGKVKSVEQTDQGLVVHFGDLTPAGERVARLLQ